MDPKKAFFEQGSSSDSWEYTPASDSWARLPDMPLPNPVKYSGSDAFMDRYILAIGGAANFKATVGTQCFPTLFTKQNDLHFFNETGSGQT